MKQILTSLATYGIAYFVLLIIVFGLQYVYPKVELHLLLNSCHTSFQDIFFKYYSLLAEWPLYVLALLPVFWKKIEMTFFFVLSELTGGVVLQILKHTFSFDRPLSAIENCSNVVLPLVDGVDMHYSNSFPSGHASTFFVFFTCCAIILACYYQQRAKQNDRRTWILFNLIQLLLLALAALGAFSRVYLSQHFLLDISVGSIIGFITPFLVFCFGRNMILKLRNKIYKKE